MYMYDGEGMGKETVVTLGRYMYIYVFVYMYTDMKTDAYFHCNSAKIF
jgi:hypothetical protein